MLYLLLASSVGWCVLAAIGITRGRHRQLIVFRSWADCWLTAILLASGSLGLVRLNLPPDFARALWVIALIGAVPWLWMTRTANSRLRDLCTVVPAKITLIMLAAFCAALAVGCGKSALSPKTEPRQRVANAAIAAGSAAAAWGIFRVIGKLATRGQSVCRCATGVR
jgi:hypothetical protein